MNRRIGVVSAVAAVVVVVVSAGLVLLVSDVQRRGRSALERERTETVTQLAASMDERVKQAFAAFGGLAGLPFDLQLGSENDAAVLEGLLAQSASQSAAYLLLDPSGLVLTEVPANTPSLVGQPYDRDGVDSALAADEPVVLPVGEGLSLAGSALPLMVAIPDGAGGLRGWLVAEITISADSSFNEEMARLGPGRGAFAYLDQNGIVVGSSDPALIGRPLPEAPPQQPGLHRIGDDVVVVEPVPAAGWTAYNTQPASVFEEGLARRAQQVIVMLVVVAGLAIALIMATLSRRLAAAREEQRRLTELNQAHEQFTRLVSHELRTPVAGVMGFLQTTVDHWDGMNEPDRRAAVERALASARRLNALTRDVLDVSAAESGELVLSLEQVDLHAEIEAAVRAMQDLHPGRRFDLVNEAGPSPVRADPDRLAQAVGALLDNAVRHSPTGEPISVTVSADDGSAVVTVSDRGPAVPSADLDRLFDQYGDARGAIPSGGFALHLARRIFEAHGGRAWATPADVGATLHASVPLTRRFESASAGPEGPKDVS